MSSAFTSGPWFRSGDTIRGYGTPIARMHEEAANREADADLILAAPEMHYVVTLASELGGVLGEKNAVVELARGALAKARGVA